MRILKKNYKLLIGIIIGSIITGTSVYAATAISSKDISYDNKSSGLTATNVKDAIDEIYDKTFTKEKITAYTYNSSTCITGEEKTCVENTCYKNKTAGSCVQGTIIKYMVNDWTQEYFYVLHDDGATITMQHRKNTIDHVGWSVGNNTNTLGPVTILPQLESATSSWHNVNTLDYTMGTTNFYGNFYTGCYPYNNCNENTYILSQRNYSKARMITMQEVVSTGCTLSGGCPKWMFNYTYGCSSYGCTQVDNGVGGSSSTVNYGYYTMSADYSLSYRAWTVRNLGTVATMNVADTFFGARAVVVITK